MQCSIHYCINQASPGVKYKKEVYFGEADEFAHVIVKVQHGTLSPDVQR